MEKPDWHLHPTMARARTGRLPRRRATACCLTPSVRAVSVWFKPRLAADESGFACSLGAGGTLLNGDRLMPWGAKWVRWAELRMAAEVAALHVGDRSVPVAPHGLAVIVWHGRQPPRAVALAPDGQELGQVRLRVGSGPTRRESRWTRQRSAVDRQVDAQPVDARVPVHCLLGMACPIAESSH